MNSTFNNSKFKGDISQWNVSKVMNMSKMFYNSSFVGDISNWDVGCSEDMNYMFYNSHFNGSLDRWTPYSLITSLTISNTSNFKLPYWGNLNSNTEIREAIVLKQKAELEKTLGIITTITPKNKVKL